MEPVQFVPTPRTGNVCRKRFPAGYSPSAFLPAAAMIFCCSFAGTRA